jgi:hypothetical protein
VSAISDIRTDIKFDLFSAQNTEILMAIAIFRFLLKYKVSTIVNFSYRLHVSSNKLEGKKIGL